MLEKIGRQLIFKIAFCIILPCIMTILMSVGMHTFRTRLPVYTHSFSTNKTRTGIISNRNTTFISTKPLAINSSYSTSPSQRTISPRLYTVKQTHIIKNNSIKYADKSTHLNKTNATKKSLQQDVQERHDLKKEQNNVPILEKINKTTHVAFLKVHKAGSTTMQNMFFRFGLNQNLNILLPKSGNFLGKKSYGMPIPSRKHYDIFACHTIYRKELFDSLLPLNSVRIGIVREPIERMISAAYYYRDVWHPKYLKKVPKENFIHNLVNYPEKYEPKFFSHTRNLMGKDFGFSENIKQTDTEEINTYLNELNSQFLLVLTVERFDESLVLMKRLLQWSIFDILYLKKNDHKHTPVILTKEEQSKFRKTSFLDFKIYEYFKRTLDEKLHKKTTEFWDEVRYFKTLIKRVSEYCLLSNDEPNLVVSKSKWSDVFNISTLDCELMKTNEGAFIRKVRARHKKMNY